MSSANLFPAAAGGGGRREVVLWAVHRLTALLMAPLILIHLFTIIMAVQGGLSAEEILGRTQGNAWAAGFYGAFVILAGAHAAIGLRGVLRETVKLRGPGLELVTAAIAGGLIFLGLRAVVGLVA